MSPGDRLRQGAGLEYIDGVLGERHDSPNALDQLTEHVVLGAGGSPMAKVLLGSLGEVAIYDYALDPAQISQHDEARKRRRFVAR